MFIIVKKTLAREKKREEVFLSSVLSLRNRRDVLRGSINGVCSRYALRVCDAGKDMIVSSSVKRLALKLKKIIGFNNSEGIHTENG